MTLTYTVLVAAVAALLSTPCLADVSDLKLGSQTGFASYYANSRTDARTASGERVNPEALTAAHGFLPLGSWIRVTNLFNGRSVNVKVNDRNAPGNRIVDLSRRAARELGIIAAGIARVRVEPIPAPAKRLASR